MIPLMNKNFRRLLLYLRLQQVLQMLSILIHRKPQEATCPKGTSIMSDKHTTDQQKLLCPPKNMSVSLTTKIYRIITTLN